MLPNVPQLNPNVFKKNVEQVPIRKGYGEGLLEAGKQDTRVVALCADLTESTQTYFFRDAFPDRFIEIGVAEQNLASVGSGMAAVGKIPFITSYAMFSPGRNWEQVRTTICYNDRPVILAGSHAGISVGPDGGTHQAIEDIALTRVLPNMTVISPCDALEARKATLAAAKLGKPVYLRLAREKTPIMTTEQTPFAIGKAQFFFVHKDIETASKKVALIATGALVYRALRVAKMLEEEGVAALVLNLATIKPLDIDAVYTAASLAGRVVTIEEHQIAGGMGSAVAEFLAKKYPVPIEFIGVKDMFGQSGTPEELIRFYGMDESAILAAVKTVLRR